MPNRKIGSTSHRDVDSLFSAAPPLPGPPALTHIHLIDTLLHPTPLVTTFHPTHRAALMKLMIWRRLGISPCLVGRSPKRPLGRPAPPAGPYAAAAGLCVRGTSCRPLLLTPAAPSLGHLHVSDPVDLDYNTLGKTLRAPRGNKLTACVRTIWQPLCLTAWLDICTVHHRCLAALPHPRGRASAVDSWPRSSRALELS
jgi:hypothetical protein